VSISPQPRWPGRHQHPVPRSWSYVTGMTYDQSTAPSVMPAADTEEPDPVWRRDSRRLNRVTRHLPGCGPSALLD
jgi:hypothetical protein